MKDKCPHCDLELSVGPGSSCNIECPIRYIKTMFAEYFTIFNYIIKFCSEEDCTLIYIREISTSSYSLIYKGEENPFKDFKNILSLKDTLNLLLTFN